MKGKLTKRRRIERGKGGKKKAQVFLSKKKKSREGKRGGGGRRKRSGFLKPANRLADSRTWDHERKNEKKVKSTGKSKAHAAIRRGRKSHE